MKFTTSRKEGIMLQFILGNSGSGKTYHLYKTIIDDSIKNPSTNYLVIVPEQFTMQTQKDLCSLHPRKGILNIDVLSFGRLAHRIFEEVGKNKLKILDDEGKNLILRKIAGDYESQLKVLRGNLKKQGYISEVKSVISEFTQYGIGFEELDAFLAELDKESALYYKLSDIRMVYEGFERYLADKYITQEEILEVLSAQASHSKLLKNSVIVLDGFTGFTPVQNRLLGELMTICKKMMITVVIDGREDVFQYKHPYQLFALSKQMATQLVKIARERHVEIQNPITLFQSPVYRFRENPELAFLESELFRYSKKQYKEKTKSISVHIARNPAIEARITVETIRKMVREHGMRYRDIAVICSDMATYASHLEKACELFQIPVFIDYKKSILLNAFAEYIRSLVAMVEQRFSYDSVFRFLRTGLTGFERDEIDQLENYVLALGIKGYKRWQERWIRETRQIDEEKLIILNSLRVRFVNMIDEFVQITKQRKKTVRDVTEAVYTFLVQQNIQEKLWDMGQAFQENQQLALAKEYAQIYRIVIELFDKFVELLGDETISLKEYADLLDAGLEEAKVGIIPPSIDQVMVGDVERTRLKSNLKALFFVGANDTLLPGNLGNGGLLSEKDKEKFAQEKLTLSPGAKEKTYIQKFYLYMNLTKPNTFLQISYSKVSAEGKSMRPAYLIQDLKKLYPNLHIQDDEERTLLECEVTNRTGLEYLVEGLRNRNYREITKQWKELYTWYKKNLLQKEEVEKILQAGFFKKEEEKLTKESANTLYGDSKRISVTRLERFAACAYAHFLTYGLRLSEREAYEFAVMDLGNIAHQALEKFSQDVRDKRKQWTELSVEEREGMIEDSVDKSIINYGNTVLYSSARNEYMIARIKGLLRTTVWALTKQMEKSDFLPSGYELNFGNGKIDRIDTCEEDNTIYIKVTDYKTGMKSFDIVALYHGLQMQLPIYLNAAMELERKKHEEKKIEPAGIFYYRIQNPIVEKETDDNLLEQKILKELKMYGLINGEKKVLEHLEHNLEGASYLNPIGKNKDGSLSRSSKVLNTKAFYAMLQYTKKKEEELREQIFSGTASILPYEFNGTTGCDYCSYRDICGFDVRLDGYEYNKLEKYSKEETVEKILEEMEEGKEDGRTMDTRAEESH